MKSLLSVLAAGGLVATFGVCDICSVPMSTANAAMALSGDEAVEPREVTLHIEGMTCGGCAISARLVLERLAGVQKAEVSYEKQLATVTYDSAKVTPQKMIDALKAKLRYTATVVEEPVR